MDIIYNGLHWQLKNPPGNRAEYYANEYYNNAGDWFAKERREHGAGLWDAAYSYQLGLLSEGQGIIDLGCGLGWFVKFCSEQGQYTIGIEPNKVARKNAVSGVLENLTDCPITGNVRLSLVLEHIENPIDFLKDIRPYVTGKLMVIVPNEFNRLQNRAGGDWFIDPDHINYFNPDGLRWVLDAAGYDIEFETATFPMEMFLAIGLDYRCNDKLGQRLHWFRLHIEKILGRRAFAFYKWLYDRWGVGRELVFVAKKRKTL